VPSRKVQVFVRQTHTSDTYLCMYHHTLDHCLNDLAEWINAGKSEKNVDAYVVMIPDTKQAVDLLNSTRQSVGATTSNPYIFARMTSDSPLSGNTDLNDIALDCPGLQHPERITDICFVLRIKAYYCCVN